MKKIVVLLMIIFALVSASHAANMFWIGDYVNGNASADWSTVDSWWDGAADFHIPIDGDTVFLDSVITGIPVSHMPTLNYDAIPASGAPDFIFMAWDSASAQLDIVNGGRLNADHLRLGNAIDSLATLNMSGDAYLVTGFMEVGYNLIHDYEDGNGPVPAAGGDGVVNMSGSSLLHVSQLIFGQELGFYDAADPLLDGEGSIDITENAKLLINGNVVSAIADRVEDGAISAYGGADQVAYFYNEDELRTEVTAAIQDSVVAVWKTDSVDNPTQWNVGANWNIGSVPGVLTHTLIQAATAEVNWPVIDTKVPSVHLLTPGWNTWQYGEVTIADGADFECDWLTRLGNDANSLGVLKMQGGKYVTAELEVGYNNLHSADPYAFSAGYGELYVDGGTLVTGSLRLAQDNLTFPEALGHGIIDVTNGTLIVNGDISAKIATLQAAGDITAFGGAGTLVVEVKPTIEFATATIITAKEYDCAVELDADINGDCVVDVADLVEVAQDWLVDARPI